MARSTVRGGACYDLALPPPTTLVHLAFSCCGSESVAARRRSGPTAAKRSTSVDRILPPPSDLGWRLLDDGHKDGAIPLDLAENPVLVKHTAIPARPAGRDVRLEVAGGRFREFGDLTQGSPDCEKRGSCGRRTERGTIRKRRCGTISRHRASPRPIGASR